MRKQLKSIKVQNSPELPFTCCHGRLARFRSEHWRRAEGLCTTWIIYFSVTSSKHVCFVILTNSPFSREFTHFLNHICMMFWASKQFIHSNDEWFMSGVHDCVKKGWTLIMYFAELFHHSNRMLVKLCRGFPTKNSDLCRMISVFYQCVALRYRGEWNRRFSLMVWIYSAFLLVLSSELKGAWN